ncbi:hypothetical protein J6590_031096 [Homalodisca vitripennis]|nr:hypothetical protein J6590_031096 [Homalodisca vitripennis]
MTRNAELLQAERRGLAGLTDMLSLLSSIWSSTSATKNYVLSSLESEISSTVETAELSSPDLAQSELPACPAIGGGSEVIFNPLVPRLSVIGLLSPNFAW